MNNDESKVGGAVSLEPPATEPALTVDQVKRAMELAEDMAIESVEWSHKAKPGKAPSRNKLREFLALAVKEGGAVPAPAGLPALTDVTPGPWEAKKDAQSNRWEVWSVNGTRVCRCRQGNGADARFIAALAPAGLHKLPDVQGHSSESDSEALRPPVDGGRE